MLTDKILEGIFEPASKYFTKGRVGCFLFAVFMETKSYELFFDKNFLGMGAQDAASKFISAMSGVSVFFLCLYASLAFWIAPKLHSWLCLGFVRIELRRVSERYLDVARIVSTCSFSSLVKDYDEIRSRAIMGEKKILRLLNFGEALFFMSIFGFLSVDYSGLSLAVLLFFVIPVLPLLYFMVQAILSEYLRSILYYKRTIERMKSNGR